MPDSQQVTTSDKHHGTQTVIPSQTEALARSLPEGRKDRAQGPKSPVLLGEVIEISSDDEPTPAFNPVIADLRRLVRKLRVENAKYQGDLVKAKRELSSAQEEIQTLKASSQAGRDQLILDASKIENTINCEICTLIMWSPHILPECGHTFCYACLHDWFNTVLTQFTNTNSHYNVNNNLFREVVQNPRAAAHFIGLQQQVAQPHYTCPVCRETVKNRPVEDFALKKLVRTVAAATGENSPKRKASKEEARISALKPNEQWDNFFPF